MMDLREATNFLNGWSKLIVSQTRYYENLAKGAVSEEHKGHIERGATSLKAQTRNSMILSILIAEAIERHSEQLALQFTEEPAALIEALKENDTATDEATKTAATLIEKFRKQEPGESVSARAIREFKARQAQRLN